MSPHAGWMLVTQVLPRLAAAIPNNCACVGAEDHQELIQDAVVMAALVAITPSAFNASDTSH